MAKGPVISDVSGWMGRLGRTSRNEAGTPGATPSQEAQEPQAPLLTDEQVRALTATLGWEREAYLAGNPDIAVIDSQGGASLLLAHFVRNGVFERRSFSESVEYANAYFFEQSMVSGEFLMCTGWSEVPLEQPQVVVAEEDADYPVVPAAHINLFRDDVAQHLGTLPKAKPYGFVLVIKAPGITPKKETRLLIRDGGQLLVGRVTPVALLLDDWMRTAFRLVEDRLTYEEMVRAFGEHPAYLRLLREAMLPIFREEPGEFRYPGRAEGEVQLSVCAVLLGRAVLLKPYLASLLARRPAAARWEILLLANAALDVENIKSAAEWASEVYGVDVTVLSTVANIGFGGGMNLLASRAKGRLAMLSNIDVRFTGLDIAALEEEAIGRGSLVAAFQFNPSGSLQHEGLTHDRRVALVNGKPLELVDTRLIGRNTYPERLERKEVEYFGAACVVAASATLRELGPFSTEYFYAYHEDTDLARRARRSGHACVLSPALQIVHYESSGALSIAMPLRALNAANLVTFMRGEAA